MKGRFAVATGRFLLASAIAFAGLIPSSQGQVVTLSDNNSVLQVNTGAQAGSFSWSVDGTNQFIQQQFWYRIGAVGGEASINTLSAPAVVTPDARTLYVTYNNGALGVEIDYVLTGAPAGSGQSRVTESIILTNDTGIAMDLHFFQYADFDLDGVLGGSWVVLSTNLFGQFAKVLQGGGYSGVRQEIGGRGGDHCEAAFYNATLTKLNDANPTTLNDNASAGPGHVTWALEWDFSVPATTSILISKTLFIEPLFYLALATNGSGTVSKSPDQTSYFLGSTVMLTATPAPGWGFSGWSGNASGTNNPLNVAMTTNKTITANFAPPVFNLTVATNGSGTITRNPDLTLYASNSTVMLTATPAPGWGFSGWSGNASGTNNPLNVAMTTNKTITANFFQPSLSVFTVGGGSVMANPGQTIDPYQIIYGHNSTVNLIPLPGLGWAFTGWSGDASGSNNPLSLIMSSNKVVFASFATGVPDVIVDNTNAAFTGSWTTDSGSVATGFWAQDFRYATTVSSSSATATFRPTLPLTGNYDVYAWVPSISQSSNRCSDAEYAISAMGVTYSIGVNENNGPSNWNYVFSAKFLQGTNGYARLSNQSTDTGKYATADAVRWAWSPNQVTQPYITSVTRGPASATLTWLSGDGSGSSYVYRLQYKTNLTDAAWLNVSGDVTATASTASKTDNTLGSAARRFYRVEILP